MNIKWAKEAFTHMTTQNVALNVINSISDLEPYAVYLDDFDRKWHIETEAPLQAFDTQQEAQKTADQMLNLAILARVAKSLDLDYGFDGKAFTIKY